MLSDLLLAIGKGGFAALVLLIDLSAASDTVDRAILLIGAYCLSLTAFKKVTWFGTCRRERTGSKFNADNGNLTQMFCVPVYHYLHFVRFTRYFAFSVFCGCHVISKLAVRRMIDQKSWRPFG